MKESSDDPVSDGDALDSSEKRNGELALRDRVGKKKKDSRCSDIENEERDPIGDAEEGREDVSGR